MMDMMLWRNCNGCDPDAVEKLQSETYQSHWLEGYELWADTKAVGGSVTMQKGA